MTQRRRARPPRLAKPLLVIDTETTGLDPATDALVQLAAIMLDPQSLAEQAAFSTLIRSQRPISAEAHAVHGLALEDLEAAPELPSAISAFAKFAEPSAVISGHNVGFDYAFLKSAYAQVGLEFPFDYHTLDIWSLSFFILGADGIELPKYNLDHLCSLYGIVRGPRHDAMEDVRASAQVLRHLFAAIGARELETLGQLRLFR